MVKVSYVQRFSQGGTTLRWWRNNDVTRALIKVHTAKESNQCIAQRYVQADMYKCMSVWAARMCLSTFAIRWYIEDIPLEFSYCLVTHDKSALGILLSRALC